MEELKLKPQPEHPPLIQSWASNGLLIVLGFVSLIGVVAGAIAFIIGILVFFLKCRPLVIAICQHYYHFFATDSGAPPADSGVLIGIIGCVEIFLAAPLPFLVSTALHRYIKDLTGAKPKAHANKRLHETKELVFSLLLSLVTVEFVSELLEAEALDQQKLMNLMFCMVFLGSFILISHKIGEREPTGEPLGDNEGKQQIAGKTGQDQTGAPSKTTDAK